MSQLVDGLGSSFSSLLGGAYLVKEITPPTIDARGGIDVSNLGTVHFLRFLPKQLKKLEAFTITVQYPPSYIDASNSVVGINDLLTFGFPDGATLTFWGWVDKIAANPLKEGEEPTAVITIMPSLCTYSGCVVTYVDPVMIDGICN